MEKETTAIDHRLGVIMASNLRKWIRDFEKQFHACIKDPVPDAVHELRVAARRVLVVIDVIAIHHHKEFRAVQKSLQQILVACGNLRDTQVLMEMMHARLADAPACRVVYEELTADEERLKKRLKKKFLGEKIFSSDALKPLQRAVPRGDEISSVAALIEATYLNLHKRLEPIAQGDTAGTHRTREIVRELRYLIDLLGGDSEPAAETQLQILRELQSVFGSVHDLVNLQKLLMQKPEGAQTVPEHCRKLAQEISKELRPMLARCIALSKQGLELRPVAMSASLDGPVHAQMYLLRHAIAKNVEKFPHDDRMRPLTKKGRRKMEKIAQGIASLKLTPDIILTSPFIRAFDTARILAKALPGDVPVRRCPWLIPSASVTTASAALAPFVRDGKSVIVVGHEPCLQQLATRLATRAGDPLRKGGLCKIAFPASDVRRKGMLVWTLTPKQLMS